MTCYGQRESWRRRPAEDLLRDDFKRQTGLPDWQVLKYWESWTDFFLKVRPPSQLAVKASETDLLEAARQVFLQTNGIPTSNQEFLGSALSRRPTIGVGGLTPLYSQLFQSGLRQGPGFPLHGRLTDNQGPRDQEADGRQTEAVSPGRVAHLREADLRVVPELPATSALADQ